MFKKMRHGVSAALAVILGAGILAGCGNSAGSTSSTGGTSAASQTNASASASVTAAQTAESPATVTITDHAGRTVSVPADPKSVVVTSVLPFASVLTVYLDSASSIKAMEPASMNAARNGILSELYPEILDVDTDIMNGDDLNIEAVAALNPDVVFYNAGNTKEAESLENAGLTAVGISPTKWNYDCIKTYEEWISLLNEIYPSRSAGREDLVEAYSKEMEEKIQAKTDALSDDEKQKVLFLFQYDDNTMVTSGSSFFGQWWCDAVGARNAAESVSADNSNATITMEQVYEWNPDVIIITNFTKTQPEDLYDNAIGSDDWSSVKAVADHRVYKMPLGTYRTYTPGVDTPLTLEWLAQAVYPELFSDVDVVADVKDYYSELYGITLTDEQVQAMYNPNSAAGTLN